MSELHTIESLDRQPFKYMVATIGNLPTSFVDSMSYYELLAWLCQYLEKTVIPAIDNNAEAVEELQAKYIELKSYVDNYFDNLDVQDEINNKLDAMAESGQLTDIIAPYLQLAAILSFSTLADMKNAKNLVDGSVTRTLGYHALNDGGGATYKIRAITNSDVVDEGSLVALLDDKLVAELVTDVANVRLFGAYGDNEHDDTTAISNAMNYARTKSIAVYFPRGKYIVTNSLPNMDAGSVMYGDESIAGNGDYSSQIIDNRSANRQWLIQYYEVDSSHLRNQRGTTIRNIAFVHEDENNEDTKWLIKFGYIMEDVLIENLFLKGYERLFYANDTNYFIFRNIRCDRIGSYTSDPTKYYAFDFEGLFGTLFDNIQTDRARYVFRITTRSGGKLGGQCRFVNCHIEQTPNFACTSTSEDAALIYIDTSYLQQFSNCMFVPADSGDYPSNAPYTIYAGSKILMDNCDFVGDYANNRKGKFIKGIAQITNCHFTNCAGRALYLSGASVVSNSSFSYFANADLTTPLFIIDNGAKEIPPCLGNQMAINLSGITALTVPPALFFSYNPYTLTCTNDKYTIKQNYQITDKWMSMFRIQKTYADFTLKRPFKLKAYYMVNGSTFYYEGIFKIDNDGTLSKVQTICGNGLTSYPIDIWYNNDKIFVQLGYQQSWLHIEVEDINGAPVTAFMDSTNPDVTGYAHLFIDS